MGSDRAYKMNRATARRMGASSTRPPAVSDSEMSPRPSAMAVAVGQKNSARDRAYLIDRFGSFIGQAWTEPPVRAGRRTRIRPAMQIHTNGPPGSLQLRCSMLATEIDVSSPGVYKWWARMSALKAMVLKGWE